MDKAFIHKSHGKLSYEQRKFLAENDPQDFVYPPSESEPLGKYPIYNESHARNALARVSANGTPEEQKAVCEAVSKRYPEIHEKSCKMH